MKPIIGITTHFEDEKKLSVHKNNYNRIIEAGGIPVILPITSNTDTVKELVSLVDGVLLTGGFDVDPYLYNEDPLQQLQDVSPGRDNFEFLLVKEILNTKTPLLAICRGAQMLNATNDGTVYQDIESQVDSEVLQHKQESICYVDNGLQAVAHADDGIIEAI